MTEKSFLTDMQRSAQKVVKLLRCDFVPFGCLIACQIHHFDEVKSLGGVIMPDGSKDVAQSPTFTVLAVGPEVKQVKAWDEVVCHQQARGGFVTLNNQKITMLREDEIIGVVDKSKHSELHRSLLRQRESTEISVA